jgi:hypothetical protein
MEVYYADRTRSSGSPGYSGAQPVERRIEDLLARMTLAEKIGQLNMPCVYESGLGQDISAKTAACRRFAEGTYTQEIGPGGGFFWRTRFFRREAGSRPTTSTNSRR